MFTELQLTTQAPLAVHEIYNEQNKQFMTFFQTHLQAIYTVTSLGGHVITHLVT